MELRWVFFLVESRHHRFGSNQHLGGVFPIWDEFISVMKGLLRFSSLNCSQASWEKAPERTKPSTPNFCLKEISVTSNQKKKRSLGKVGFFWGGESSNVASDFFLNICLKQFSQKIVGFFCENVTARWP